MTWQEAVRRAAEGGCPLLRQQEDNTFIRQYDTYEKDFWWCALEPMVLRHKQVQAHYELQAVMVALAWYWDKTDECTDNEYSAYMESIRSLRARRAELEKEMNN
jgi:hypothetical protein